VAKIDLRLPFIIGGAFAFVLALTHAHFIKSVGDSGAAGLEDVVSSSEE
jgi:hypothetical protein